MYINAQSRAEVVTSVEDISLSSYLSEDNMYSKVSAALLASPTCEWPCRGSVAADRFRDPLKSGVETLEGWKKKDYYL